MAPARRPPVKIHTWGDPHKKTNKKRKRSIVRKSREDENGDASEFNKLCENLICNVFIRCPMKTLAMLRCASKSWNDLITSPSFLHSHQEQSTESPQLLFLNPIMSYEPRVSRCELRFVSVDMEGKGESNELYSVTVRHFRHNGMLVCSGLVCLSAYPLIYLCNPVMKQFCKLPQGEVSPGALAGNDCFGFGYLHSTKEYKVVRFFKKTRFQRRCEVFTVNGAAATGGITSTNRWKEIGETPPSVPQGPGVLVNECLYWLARELPLAKPDRILSFELENEKFLTISRPSSFDQTLSDTTMLDLKGMLCLPDMGHFHRTSVLDVWILKDKMSCLWVKGYNINFAGFEPPIRTSVPLFRTGNDDEIIFVNQGTVVFYDLKTSRVRTRMSLEIYRSISHLHRIGFSVYQKSLFSLY